MKVRLQIIMMILVTLLISSCGNEIQDYSYVYEVNTCIRQGGSITMIIGRSNGSYTINDIDGSIKIINARQFEDNLARQQYDLYRCTGDKIRI